MQSSQKALQRAAAQLSCSAHRPAATAAIARRQWARSASNSAHPDNQRRLGGRIAGFAAVFAAAGAVAYYFPQFSASSSPEPEQAERAEAELEFEKARKQAVSKEDNRDLISSQHIKVRNSWEHPGVYAWGSNTGKVIDPDSNDRYAKLPRRINFFNDQLLRDLKLTREFGAAITEMGDLVQWGLGYSQANPRPETTLRGKDLVKLDVSADRIIALSRQGAVYSIPTSRDDQQHGPKSEQGSSIWSLWTTAGGKEPISFRNIAPVTLGRGERVTDISSGLEHCLMITNRGRLFSAVSSIASFPSKGQMGIPGFSWETRPAGPFDQAHEVTTLSGFNIDKIAAGDFHSVVSDKAGRVFTFGDNTFGQLGFEAEMRLPTLAAPTMVSINKLYGNTGLIPRVTSVAAGGSNTFFTIDAEAPKQPLPLSPMQTAPARRMPRTASDVWACGQGVYGSLGTGKWTHVSQGPTKVKALSSLFEFDEQANRMIPIKLKQLSVGSTHCAAVMDNVTETSISKHSTANETNWGADVLFWGGNEHYQLGTGKRANTNAPTYIGPLDGGSADAGAGRAGEVHRLCLTPRSTARVGEGGKGRRVALEQKVECGRYVTGVYSAV